MCVIQKHPQKEICFTTGTTIQCLQIHQYELCVPEHPVVFWAGDLHRMKHLNTMNLLVGFSVKRSAAFRVTSPIP